MPISSAAYPGGGLMYGWFVEGSVAGAVVIGAGLLGSGISLDGLDRVLGGELWSFSPFPAMTKCAFFRSRR
jgi:hypothetical protein